MKMFIVIIPWDYTTADADVFRTRKEAEAYIAENGERAKHYASIKEVDV